MLEVAYLTSHQEKINHLHRGKDITCVICWRTFWLIFPHFCLFSAHTGLIMKRHNALWRPFLEHRTYQKPLNYLKKLKCDTTTTAYTSSDRAKYFFVLLITLPSSNIIFVFSFLFISACLSLPCSSPAFLLKS